MNKPALILAAVIVLVVCVAALLSSRPSAPRVTGGSRTTAFGTTTAASGGATTTLPNFDSGPPLASKSGKPTTIKYPYLPGDGGDNDNTHGRDNGPAQLAPKQSSSTYVAPEQIGPFLKDVPYADSVVSIAVGPDGFAGAQVELIVTYTGTAAQASADVQKLMGAAGDSASNYVLLYLAAK